MYILQIQIYICLARSPVRGPLLRTVVLVVVAVAVVAVAVAVAVVAVVVVVVAVVVVVIVVVVVVNMSFVDKCMVNNKQLDDDSS